MKPLFRVIIREPGQITEIESVRAECFHDAMLSVKLQLISEGRNVQNVTFEASKVDESNETRRA